MEYTPSAWTKSLFTFDNFFQESFESESKRLESFPTNWAEINGLAVSVEEIAIAGQVGFKGVARELVERKPR